jgi:hypothetical protein
MGPPGPRDEAWFTGLYAAHFGQVVSYGRRRLGDVDASAELAQEVFVIAWRRRAEVPDRSLPWLYGVDRSPFPWPSPAGRADRGGPMAPAGERAGSGSHAQTRS